MEKQGQEQEEGKVSGSYLKAFFKLRSEIFSMPHKLHSLLTGKALPPLQIQARATIAEVKEFPSPVQSHARNEGTLVFLEQLIIGF